jgi:predicted dehydrogenase
VSVADLTRDDPLKLQLEHFGRVVRDEAAPLVSARDGLQNLRITEAIVRAAREGVVVDTATDSVAHDPVAHSAIHSVTH